jgi:hypothetical protein
LPSLINSSTPDFYFRRGRVMAKSPKLKLKIQNENYDEFNGFEINFSGFDKIPWRFSPLGFATGKYLLEQLKGKFGEFELVVAKEETSRIDTKKTPTQVTLQYDDIMNIRRDFRRNYRLEGDKMVTKHLATLFPEMFAQESEADLPTDIREIDLSNEDIQKANQILPFLEKYDINSRSALKRLLASRKVLHYMYLEKVLQDFENRLKSEQEESEWQAFFKKNLLILNPGYMKIIERPNISLAIKFPDFLLITIEGYADLYEIKTPATPLLAYDQSHKNYYWSSDISKAIAQIENYVDTLNKNSQGLVEELRDQIELKIVRPRGYIIAGHSSQLREQKKNDNFRLLNEALKSTEVLPYDSFLERFKSFSKTLKEFA